MINLRSDTVTRPSDAMREAARDAEVGDDVHRQDPTVAELEARAADVVGTEAALFVPSGTMGNQIAVRVHTDRGQEVLLERESHIYKWELAGVAQHANCQPRTVDGGPRGGGGNADVEDGPGHRKQPVGRCPERFFQVLVPVARLKDRARGARGDAGEEENRKKYKIHPPDIGQARRPANSAVRRS